MRSTPFWLGELRVAVCAEKRASKAALLYADTERRIAKSLRR